MLILNNRSLDAFGKFRSSIFGVFRRYIYNKYADICEIAQTRGQFHNILSNDECTLGLHKSFCLKKIRHTFAIELCSEVSDLPNEA